MAHGCRSAHAVRNPAQSCSFARSPPHPQEWLPDSLEWDWPNNPVEYSEAPAAWLSIVRTAHECSSGEAQCWMGKLGDDQCQHPGACCQPLPRMCPTPRSAAANGTTVPPKSDVQKLTALICSDTEAAGEQIRTDVQKGGKAAQVGVRHLKQGALGPAAQLAPPSCIQ